MGHSYAGTPNTVPTVAAAGCLAPWFDLLAFGVPINLGTLEASRIGVAFGTAIRAAQVLWAVFGLGSYAFSTLRRKAAVPPLYDCPETNFARNICMEER